MKRLVSILLFVFAVATGFAQSSTPDYIQKAKVGLTQYYPQFKDYFEPIFVEYNKLGANAHNIFYSKIYENFDTFKEELTTERDKCAVILSAIDDLLGDKKFRNSKKQVDSPEGEDTIDGIADIIASEIKAQFSRKLRESRESLAKSRESLAKSRESLAKSREDLVKTNEILKKMNLNKDNPKVLVELLEEFFGIIDIDTITDDTVTQNIINYYENICEHINHTPSPTAQKFIDEYNRITKSK